MNNFPTENPVANRKLTKPEMWICLQKKTFLSQISFDLIEEEKLLDGRHICDGIVGVRWRNKGEQFVAELISTSSPNSIEQARLRLAEVASLLSRRAIIIAPYLSEVTLNALADLNISGVDLSGNAMIIGENFQIAEIGAPNLFKESRPLKNPFSGDSSVFSRCFLLKDSFVSLGNLQEYARSKRIVDPTHVDRSLLLGTASKAVSALADELIVKHDHDGIQLLNRAQLVENLRSRYRRKETERIVGKTLLSSSEIWSRLRRAETDGQFRSVATGISSARFHQVLFGEDKLSLYVGDLTEAAELLEIKPGHAFANIELIEDQMNLVYFDYQVEGKARWSSQIQTWLELSQGNSREQDAGRKLLSYILDKVNRK